MAVYCPRCERQYDVTLFEFGRTVRCECGAFVGSPGSGVSASHITVSRPTEVQAAAARAACDRLRLAADHVCRMILSRDYADIDIEIERGRVRDLCAELFPDRMDLYEMIYESRFERLWAQFRAAEGGPC